MNALTPHQYKLSLQGAGSTPASPLRLPSKTADLYPCTAIFPASPVSVFTPQITFFTCFNDYAQPLIKARKSHADARDLSQKGVPS